LNWIPMKSATHGHSPSKKKKKKGDETAEKRGSAQREKKGLFREMVQRRRRGIVAIPRKTSRKFWAGEKIKKGVLHTGKRLASSHTGEKKSFQGENPVYEQEEVAEKTKGKGSFAGERK